MLNKQLLFLVLFFTIFVTLTVVQAVETAAPNSIEIKRIIEQGAESGKTVDIKISIDTKGADISSLIITEEIPAGWELVSSTPQADQFEGKAKWLLYGSSLTNKVTLIYTLKAPTSFSKPQEVNGKWDVIGPDWGPIMGDVFIYKAEPVAPPPSEPLPKPEEPKQDYMMYLLGAIVILLVIVVALQLMKKK